MSVLQPQSGKGWDCFYCTGRRASHVNRHIDELLAVWVDETNADQISKILLYFEYLGAEGYGYGIIYASCRDGSLDEDDCECLLLLSGNPEHAMQFAESYALHVARQLGLQPMLFVTIA